MRTPKTRTAWYLFALVFVASSAWALFQTFRSPAGRINLSTRLLGYTNDNSGIRLAMIAVTNMGNSTVFVYMPRIRMSASVEAGDAQTLSYIPNAWHAKLNEGASGSFTIPSPTNQLPWKLCFWVYDDFRPIQVVQRFFMGRRHMPSTIETDWLNPYK